MYSLCRVIRSHGRQRIDPGVSESVTRPFQGQNLCVMDDSVDHRGSDCLIAEYVTHRPNGRFDVRISEACS